jgi:hypothetical protein
MGTGCKSVVRVFKNDTDISIGVWSDNRIGVNRAMRTGRKGRGGTAYGDKEIVSFKRDASADENNVFAPYKNMIDFFSTGIVPVRPEQTLEVLAFMEAAEESRLNGGKEVEIETIMQRARNSDGRLELNQL